MSRNVELMKTGRERQAVEDDWAGAMDNPSMRDTRLGFRD
jgi:hypothetical protein